uniref:sulfite oxidase n=1 Tax=Romanomermis culicivorax TaxID=13658 RepID=A0A915HR92_ROMCU
MLNVCRKLSTNLFAKRGINFMKRKFPPIYISSNLPFNPHKISSDDDDKFHGNRGYVHPVSFTIFAGFLYAFYWKIFTAGKVKAETISAETSESKLSAETSESKPKVFTRNEIRNHKTKETGIWVTYKNGVYDVTNFVDYHPGGDKILMAAGGSVDPFWNLYAVHKTSDVLEILEEMRIGDLDTNDILTEKSSSDTDPYANDPPRHPALVVCSEKPFNAETPPTLLTDSYYTPNEVFFVRNHLPVPKVDVNEYRLEVSGKGLQTKFFTLQELKEKFEVVSVSATLQCAGNRRDEMNPIKHVKGLTWGSTAISNAKWTGVRLCDVLADCGCDQAMAVKENLQHVQFEGLDDDPTSQNTRYGASIEIDRATTPKNDVILAFEMNGVPLPTDHGFPLRVVVPGVVGARNVKWLSKIIVSDEESYSHWQRNDYKSFCPSVDWDTVDFGSAPAIQEYPVQSAICIPRNGDKVDKTCFSIDVKGYAWSGGGRRIIRVDVSADNGRTWQVAQLERDPSQTAYRSWAWTLWSCSLPIKFDADVDQIKLVCKATDVAYNSQPDSVSGVWNLRGVLNNAWSRVTVQVT